MGTLILFLILVIRAVFASLIVANPGEPTF
jgi:hypothetical protein